MGLRTAEQGATDYIAIHDSEALLARDGNTLAIVLELLGTEDDRSGLEIGLEIAGRST